ESQENERLLYVALTRARAKLYLPFFPPGSITKPSGYYSRLNSRLAEVVEESGQRGKKRNPVLDLFSLETLREEKPAKSTTLDSLESWSAPNELLAEDDEDRSREFGKMARDHSPFMMRSYTSLKPSEPRWEIPVE